ncbi:MAG: hypothetical protein P8M78_15150, partial [Myxococcota bacterium]|nr:hypothetical protein [Myxococcota bacterium]
PLPDIAQGALWAFGILVCKPLVAVYFSSFMISSSLGSVSISWLAWLDVRAMGVRCKSFGASESTVAPVARNAHPFTLLPPSSPSGSAGLVFSRIFFRPTPRERPIGELTGTRLEFNKAAWAGSAYLEFTASMGLPAP